MGAKREFNVRSSARLLNVIRSNIQLFHEGMEEKIHIVLISNSKGRRNLLVASTNGGRPGHITGDHLFFVEELYYGIDREGKSILVEDRSPRVLMIWTWTFSGILLIRKSPFSIRHCTVGYHVSFLVGGSLLDLGLLEHWFLTYSTHTVRGEVWNWLASKLFSLMISSHN